MPFGYPSLGPPGPPPDVATEGLMSGTGWGLEGGSGEEPAWLFDPLSLPVVN